MPDEMVVTWEPSEFPPLAVGESFTLDVHVANAEDGMTLRCTVRGLAVMVNGKNGSADNVLKTEIDHTDTVRFTIVPDEEGDGEICISKMVGRLPKLLHRIPFTVGTVAETNGVETSVEEPSPVARDPEDPHEPAAIHGKIHLLPAPPPVALDMAFTDEPEPPTENTDETLRIGPARTTLAGHANPLRAPTSGGLVPRPVVAVPRPVVVPRPVRDPSTAQTMPDGVHVELPPPRPTPTPPAPRTDVTVQLDKALGPAGPKEIDMRDLRPADGKNWKPLMGALGVLAGLAIVAVMFVVQRPPAPQPPDEPIAPPPPPVAVVAEPEPPPAAEPVAVAVPELVAPPVVAPEPPVAPEPAVVPPAPEPVVAAPEPIPAPVIIPPSEPVEPPETLVVSSMGKKPACKTACTWGNIDPKDGYPLSPGGTYTVTCGEDTWSVDKITRITSGKDQHCYSATGISNAPDGP